MRVQLVAPVANAANEALQERPPGVLDMRRDRAPGLVLQIQLDVPLENDSSRSRCLIEAGIACHRSRKAHGERPILREPGSDNGNEGADVIAPANHLSFLYRPATGNWDSPNDDSVTPDLGLLDLLRADVDRPERLERLVFHWRRYTLESPKAVQRNGSGKAVDRHCRHRPRVERRYLDGWNVVKEWGGGARGADMLGALGGRGSIAFVEMKWQNKRKGHS